MNGFQSVFDKAEGVEEEFDTMFGSEEDGSLIDTVCGFNESGECETDFDEIHQTQGDSDPDDMAHDLRVDDETDNAPNGAEGTDTDPAIDLALGETADDSFSANGVKGKTDADDFYAGFNKPEETSATTGEGPDVHMDNQNIEDEFEKMVEAVTGQSDTDESEDEGQVKGDDYEESGLTIDENMDRVMEGLDGEEGEDDQSIKESDEYEEGDADLIDLIAGE